MAGRIIRSLARPRTSLKLLPFLFFGAFAVLLLLKHIASLRKGMNPLQKPTLALLGAGLFVKDQYVGILKELSGSIEVKAVWSRTQKAAEEVTALVNEYSDASSFFGDEGLQTILDDPRIHAVAVVLPAQIQPEVVIRALRAGKHVIQEKPVAASLREARAVLSAYHDLSQGGAPPPIWAVAENYRFEPALQEAARLVPTIGDIMIVHVAVEAPMNEGNQYFASTWRRDPKFHGAFLIDGGVHFIAGLRLIVGSEVATVTAVTSHMDETLPPPDNLVAIMQFENGATGTLAMSYSATSRKASWRVVGSNGTVEAERAAENGKHGYMTTFYPPKGPPTKSFFPFEGVQNELKAFVNDVSRARFKAEGWKPHSGSAFREAMCDLAVVEAMLTSADNTVANQAVETI